MQRSSADGMLPLVLRLIVPFDARGANPLDRRAIAIERSSGSPSQP